MSNNRSAWNPSVKFARVLWMAVRGHHDHHTALAVLRRTHIRWADIEEYRVSLTYKQQLAFEALLPPEVVVKIHEANPVDNRPTRWQQILGDRYGRVTESLGVDRQPRRRS